MSQATILLIEDDRKIRDTNTKLLRFSGHSILGAATLARAREILAERTPDLIILDVMLPDGNGFAFCSELRAFCSAPVLFLTALGETGDMLRGYDAGAVDYISKPYSVEILTAKVDVLLRLTRPDITLGPLELNLATGQAYLNGHNLLLAQKEFGVLYMLAESNGRTVTAEQLYEKVWGAPMAGDNHAVKNSVYRLRKKLEEGESGLHISTVRGEGYHLDFVRTAGLYASAR